MYVVTGGAGFIGSAFVWKLNREGISDILIVDHADNPSKKKNIEKLKYTDLISKEEFRKKVKDNAMPKGVKAIVHMGACTSTTEQDVAYLTDNNFLYSKILAKWAIANGTRFIYASSAATYGDGALGYSDDEDVIEGLEPMNPYGRSKQDFDKWALGSGALKKIVGIKYFNVFGPNEYHKGDMRSMVHKAFGQIQSTQKIRLFKSHKPEYKHGEQKRDFIYIKDCINVMWWFLASPSITGIYNLGTGKARTWNDLASAVFSAMGAPQKIEYIDMPPAIRGNYQYFTEAGMEKLGSVGCPLGPNSLEGSIKDYVQGYLLKENKHLE